MRQRKTSPRLKDFDYAGSHAYFVTCTTEQRKTHFRNKSIVDTLLPVIEKTSRRMGFGVYAYCFMPDHLHILLIGTEDSSLHKFMQLFKQQSSFAFRKVYSDSLWQRSYYDHILRKEEALNDMALYIFNNPVRKGLVIDYRDYPFSGSFVFNAIELLARQ